MMLQCLHVLYEAYSTISILPHVGDLGGLDGEKEMARNRTSLFPLGLTREM